MEKEKEFFNGFDDDILIDDDFIEDDENTGDESNADDKTDDKDNKTAVDDKTKTSEDDAKKEDVNSDNGKSDDDEKAKEAELKAKEAEKNAKFAELRRKTEAEAKAKKEREAEEKRIRSEAKLEAELGAYKVNPYTNEPISDENDLAIFKIQRELEVEGKNPVKDLGKRMAELDRQKAESVRKEEEAKKQEQAKLEENAKREVKELRERHPELNTAELIKDPLWAESFAKYGGKLELPDIYDLVYLPKKSLEKKEGDKGLEENSKKMSRVPSSQSNGGKTSKNYLEMTDEEYLANEKKEASDDFF